MEHTLEKYLTRQSTAALENLLENILSGTLAEDYSYVIPIILEILQKRKASPS